MTIKAIIRLKQLQSQRMALKQVKQARPFHGRVSISALWWGISAERNGVCLQAKKKQCGTSWETFLTYEVHHKNHGIHVATQSDQQVYPAVRHFQLRMYSEYEKDTYHIHRHIYFVPKCAEYHLLKIQGRLFNSLSPTTFPGSHLLALGTLKAFVPPFDSYLYWKEVMMSQISVASMPHWQTESSPAPSALCENRQLQCIMQNFANRSSADSPTSLAGRSTAAGRLSIRSKIQNQWSWYFGRVRIVHCIPARNVSELYMFSSILRAHDRGNTWWNAWDSEGKTSIPQSRWASSIILARGKRCACPSTWTQLCYGQILLARNVMHVQL